MALTAPRKARPGSPLGQILPFPGQPNLPDIGQLPPGREKVSPDLFGGLTPVQEPPPDPGMPPVEAPPSTGEVAEYLGGPPGMEGITPVQDITGAPQKPQRPGFLPALGRALLKIAPVAGELLQGAAEGAQSPGFLTAAGNTYRTARMEPLLAIQQLAKAQKTQAETERQRAAGEYDYARAAKTDTETGYIPAEQERATQAAGDKSLLDRANKLLAESRAEYIGKQAAGYSGRNEAEIRRLNATGAQARAQATLTEELIDAGMPDAQAKAMAELAVQRAAQSEFISKQTELLPRGMAAREKSAQAAATSAQAALQRAQRAAQPGNPATYARAIGGLYEDREQAINEIRDAEMMGQIQPDQASAQIQALRNEYKSVLDVMNRQLQGGPGGGTNPNDPLGILGP